MSPGQTIIKLYQSTVANINAHLRAICAEGELRPEATIKSCLIVRREARRTVERSVKHYNVAPSSRSAS